MIFMDYDGTLREMRNALVKDIKDIFAKHEGKTETVHWGEACCDIPVIKDADTDDGIYTLDRVRCENGHIVFDASNSYDCEDFDAEDSYVETLLYVRNIMIGSEDKLFDEELYYEDYVE